MAVLVAFCHIEHTALDGMDLGAHEKSNGLIAIWVRTQRDMGAPRFLWRKQVDVRRADTRTPHGQHHLGDREVMGSYAAFWFVLRFGGVDHGPASYIHVFVGSTVAVRVFGSASGWGGRPRVPFFAPVVPQRFALAFLVVWAHCRAQAVLGTLP